MQWGGFAGGLADGFEKGMRMGKSINDMIKENGIKNLREQASAEAKASYDADVSKRVTENAPKASDAATKATTATGSPQETPGVTTVSPVVQPETTTIPPATAPAAAAPAAMPSAAQPQVAAPQVAQPQAAPQAAAQPPVDIPAAPQGVQQQAQPTAAQPAAAGIPNMPFSVGGQGYATREEALAAAKKEGPSLQDVTGERVSKAMADYYIGQGDPEKADKFTKWSKDKKNEAKIQTWADASQLFKASDYMGSARKILKMHPNFDDGLTIKSATAVKDDQGRETGFKLVFTDASGKEHTQEHNAETIARIGLEAMNPMAQAEKDDAAARAAPVARAKAAADAANDSRDLRKQLIVEGVKADTAREAATVKDNRDMQTLTIKDQLEDAKLGRVESQKVQTKIDFLGRSGFTQGQINALMPALVGVGDFKKMTDPVETRGQILKLLLDKSFDFQNEKDPAKQRAMIDTFMVMQYGEGSTGNPAAPRAVANPVSAATAGGGLPAEQKTVPFQKPDGTIVRIPSR